MFVLGCCLAIAGIAYTATASVDEAEFAALKQQVADMNKSPLPAGLTFHGYFRGRLSSSEADGSTWESTEVAFQPRWDASSKVHGEAHIWFWPSVGYTYMESGMMILDDVGIGEGSKLILGKNRSWCYGITPHGKNRKTSNYSLYNAAINQARVTGLQSLNKLDNGKIDLNIGILNGYLIGSTTGTSSSARTVGVASYTGSKQKATTDSYGLLANKDSGYENNNNRAVSIRLAGKVIPSLKIGASYYTSKVIATDAAALATLSGKTDSTRTHDMLGVDFQYNNGTWMFQGEYTDGQIASLDFDGFQTLIGYNFDAANSLYVEYGQLNYDLNYSLDASGATAASGVAALTDVWDKQQVIISYKHKLAPRAWLQFEQEFNMEDEPAIAGTDFSSFTDNDLTFVEFMIVY